MSTIFSKINAFFRIQNGTSGIEFAFALPILLLLMAGAIELSNYVYAGQKNQNAANNIGNIINLGEDNSPATLRAISLTFPRIVKPFVVGDNEYRVIVTAIQRDRDMDKDNPLSQGYIRWQWASKGGSGTSQFKYNPRAGREKNMVEPSAINNFQFAIGDQILIIETFMPFRPLMDNQLTRSILGLKDDNTIYYQSPLSAHAWDHSNSPQTASFSGRSKSIES